MPGRPRELGVLWALREALVDALHHLQVVQRGTELAPERGGVDSVGKRRLRKGTVQMKEQHRPQALAAAPAVLGRVLLQADVQRVEQVGRFRTSHSTLPSRVVRHESCSMATASVDHSPSSSGWVPSGTMSAYPHVDGMAKRPASPGSDRTTEASIAEVASSKSRRSTIALGTSLLTTTTGRSSRRAASRTSSTSRSRSPRCTGARSRASARGSRSPHRRPARRPRCRWSRCRGSSSTRAGTCAPREPPPPLPPGPVSAGASGSRR